MRYLIIVLFSFAITLHAGSSSQAEKLLKIKEQELSALKDRLEQTRDSLQYETTQRYTIKQRLMQQREADKEEFDRLRELQERTASQLSQAKEESLTKEQQLAEERKVTTGKQDEWSSILNSCSEIFSKDASGIVECFPVEREKRQADLETIRRVYGSDRDPSNAWNSYSTYRAVYITSGNSLAITHEKLALDVGPLVNITLARFGNVFAYGLDTAGAAYILRQTGRLGAEKYSLSKIGSQELSAFVSKALPEWVRNGKPSGEIMFDILQNEQSSLLISGKKVSWWEGTFHSVKQGGAVMIPLLLLPLWVLYLVFRKRFQISSRKGKFSRQFKKVMSLIDKNDFSGALDYTKSSKGALARILQTCIEYRSHDRHGCERAVREIIYHEIPVVNRNINTVAVIAGAAPLLGLLGTISGMITLFAAVTHYGTGDPKFLAGGISEALITAKTGLAIAIPSLFLHDWLKSGKESLFAEMEEYAAHTINRFWPEG